MYAVSCGHTVPYRLVCAWSATGTYPGAYQNEESAVIVLHLVVRMAGLQQLYPKNNDAALYVSFDGIPSCRWGCLWKIWYGSWCIAISVSLQIYANFGDPTRKVQTMSLISTWIKFIRNKSIFQYETVHLLWTESGSKALCSVHKGKSVDSQNFLMENYVSITVFWNMLYIIPLFS